MNRSYKAAFERLEAPISNLLLISKTQTALIDGILPDCEPRHISVDQNEAIGHKASLVRNVAEELDSLWLDAHNEEGAPVADTSAAEPAVTANEHRVSLHKREGEADTLVSITDAVNSVQNLIDVLTAIDLHAPPKVVINGFWTGLCVIQSAMEDVSARLEAELDRRAGR